MRHTIESIGWQFAENSVSGGGAVAAPGATDAILAAMRAHPLGLEACVIGEVTADDQYFVQMTTSFGGGRIVDWLAGEQLPRIC